MAEADTGAVSGGHFEGGSGGTFAESAQGVGSLGGGGNLESGETVVLVAWGGNIGAGVGLKLRGVSAEECSAS